MISNLLSLFFSFPALAASPVVGSTPDVAWLMKRIGGKEVEVRALATGTTNYHFAEARPDYVLRVSRARLLCRVGAELEDAWLDKVVEKAANRRVMPGAPGDCSLHRTVTIEEKPTGPVDRSMVDVHAAGNNHFWLSPLRMIEAAKEVEERLGAVFPEKAEIFATNRAKLEKELKVLHSRLKSRLSPLEGKSFLQYHKDFYYFLVDYGLSSADSIEEIPGVSPSAARLGQISLRAKRDKVALALASEHDPRSQLEKFREISGVPYLQLPTSLSSPGDADAFARWQESMVDRILKAAHAGG
jgi:zinc/manganese transport system substrate-binding protein